MINFTTIDVTPEEERGIGEQVVTIIRIAIIIGAVVASLLLILSTACQRILRVPFYVVMASWALSNLICSAFMITSVMVELNRSWPYSGIFCSYFEYVWKAVALIRLYHVPLAAIVACFSRKFLVWFRSYPWANIVIPIVLCLHVWVAFFILATPYIGSYKLVRNFDDRLTCTPSVPMNYNQTIIMDSVFMYLVPFLCSIVMLIVWASVFVRRSRAVHVLVWRRENSEGIVLFIVIHVFIVLRLALMLFNYLQTTALFSGHFDLFNLVYRIVSIVASSDYFLAPLFCLLFVASYRNIFCLPCRGQADVYDTVLEPAAIPLKCEVNP